MNDFLNYIYPVKDYPKGDLDNWEKINQRPSSVSIETISNCNRTCSYCPQSKFDRSGTKLSTDVFKNVIDELAEWGFSGTFEPGWLGEPLLDVRIFDLASYARQKLPKAKIHLTTNGDALTPQKLKILLDDCFHTIRITQHDATFEKEEEVRNFLEEYPQYKRRLTILRPGWEPLSWSGVVAGHPRSMYRNRCAWSEKIIINAWGQSGLCCTDVYAELGFGSIYEKTLKEIWRESEPMRRTLYFGEHVKKSPCKECVGAPSVSERIRESSKFVLKSVGILEAVRKVQDIGLNRRVDRKGRLG